MRAEEDRVKRGRRVKCTAARGLTFAKMRRDFPDSRHRRMLKGRRACWISRVSASLQRVREKLEVFDRLREGREKLEV